MTKEELLAAMQAAIDSRHGRRGRPPLTLADLLREDLSIVIEAIENGPAATAKHRNASEEWLKKHVQRRRPIAELDMHLRREAQAACEIRTRASALSPEANRWLGDFTPGSARQVLDAFGVQTGEPCHALEAALAELLSLTPRT